MPKMVTLTIDDIEVQVPEGTLIVDAAKKFGIDIPVFCYHPKMEPVGMCRMCLVEIGRPSRDRATGELVLDENGQPDIQFGLKLETACTTPVSDGMVVLGASEKAARGRQDIIEFLLTSHPLDCPICDKGGECPLQNLTMGFGPGQSRFIYDEKFQFRKHVPLGELIVLDRERCIQCARCIRFQDEIVDDPVIEFFQRGRALEIVTFSEPGFDSYFSGNTTDICPVGALTTTDFRFEARPWELKAAASICPHCPVGCNTTANIRREARAGGKVVVKRIMPRQNEKVNEIWICDKGRFAYHYVQSGERLSQPLVRKNDVLEQVTWPEAFEFVAEHLRQAGRDALFLGSGRMSNEDLFNLRLLAEGVGGKTAQYVQMGGGDQVAQVGVGKGTNFSEMGPGTAILVVACDLEEEAPIWWLRVKQAAERGAQVIVANARPTKLDRSAAYQIRYPFGTEAATVLAMVNALSAKRPETGRGDVQGPSPRDVEEAAKVFAQSENAVVIYGKDGLGLAGTQALAQACANLLISTNHTGHSNNGLIAAWPVANNQGAWDMGLKPLDDLAGAITGSKAVVIAAADPAGDDPRLAEAVRAAGFVVVQELFMTDTAALADVVLPAQSFAEREGTYTNGERRVQRFYPAIPALPLGLPDYEITAEIGKRLGLDLEARAPGLVMDKHIAARVPDYAEITYRKLAQVEEQWPIIGRGDVYYGGTSYDNSQGMGVKLSSAAERGESPALGWVEPAPARRPEDGLLAVPVTRLYDQGRLMLYSKLLRPRIPALHVALNPEDAARLSLKEGDLAAVQLGGGDQTAVAPRFEVENVSVRVFEDVPPGIVLVPRSLGLAIHEPAPVTLRAMAAARA